MPLKRTPASAKEDVGLAKGFRSGLEDVIAEQIASQGHPVEYEAFIIPYTRPSRASKYHPDFRLANGIVIETKGRFEVDDRQKHILIKDQHPEFDIRFVFSNSKQRIRKGSPTRYCDWCDKNGFKYADKRIPLAWFKEPSK